MVFRRRLSAATPLVLFRIPPSAELTPLPDLASALLVRLTSLSPSLTLVISPTALDFGFDSASSSDFSVALASVWIPRRSCLTFCEPAAVCGSILRSEERRVGKECQYV